MYATRTHIMYGVNPHYVRLLSHKMYVKAPHYVRFWSTLRTFYAYPHYVRNSYKSLNKKAFET